MIFGLKASWSASFDMFDNYTRHEARGMRRFAMGTQQIADESLGEMVCTDCGRLLAERKIFFDRHVLSEVALCPNCLPAFQQRQYFPPGCCG